MEEKSYVGMTNCYFCGKSKDILIDTRLRDRFPREIGVIDMEPCNDCRSLMEKEIMFICIKNDTPDEEMKKKFPNPYRTGAMAVVKEEAAKKFMAEEMFESVKKARFCFMSEGAWDLIGLPKGEKE